ncbi:glutathione S-transferase family protein [Bradyrhizobium sp. NP1]|uniref:glutathione S-transferase family protein n=1 Tax=Bradyrhizobium sp. NP1 TaxID=3049772 RepID=UPI0025A4FECA|nr:glutathione S-transferase family protein [Bradyrhizobium sp. NP1]WJR79684.1 glutathione S-transferase family protein [Bradyrhizobium sp. NP1]
MKIHGDSNSGNCLKVKWVCDKLAISYDWIEIDILKGESRTGEFLRLNSAGQVPTVVFDDGRTLAQSNAIIKYLARDSELVPRDALVAAQMDAWLFWEQNSHEPFVAVCRFHTVYLGKPVSEVDPNLIKRGHAALGHMDRHLAGNRFMLGDTFSLADVALLAYTRVAPEGGLELSPYASLRRWIGESESELGLRRNAS